MHYFRTEIYILKMILLIRKVIFLSQVIVLLIQSLKLKSALLTYLKHIFLKCICIKQYVFSIQRAVQYKSKTGCSIYMRWKSCELKWF